MTPARPQPLPIAACSLDRAGAEAQGRRYAAIGAQVRAAERTPGRLEVQFADAVDSGLVGEAVTVERGCCEFFAIEWEPATRRLRFEVARAEQDPALDAIAAALGLGELGGVRAGGR